MLGMMRLAAVLVFGMMLFGAAPEPAYAQGQNCSVSGGASGRVIVSNIRQRLRDPNGRPLRCSPTPNGNGRTILNIKWLTSDNRRVDVSVDARSGAILGVRGN
jgi:hypothetical protein